ncbi:MAG: PAS domain-containing sensor histidine kinase [Elusimicrobia bacterium]|nr:PAS domain-containing sensor histidine kinase [Elusimicrobiota bacterium]
MDELDTIVTSGTGLRDLLESIDDLVCLATLEGRILYVNRAWREKLGYSKEEIGAVNSYQMIHPHHKEDIQKTNARMMAGEELLHVERTMVSKTGQQYEVEGSLSCRFKDGKPWYVRAIFRDITARKQVERMKDELISMASHELRNPLMAIRTSLQLLQEEMSPADPKGRPAQIVELGLRNSDRMLDLINAYLDLAKIEAGAAFAQKEVDVAAFIAHVVELIRPLGLRSGIEIREEHAARGARVSGDEDRLAQVLTNLVSNAMKFSKPGGAVTVRSEQKEGAVRVSVVDQGSGIPEEFRHKIFGKFAQAEGHRRGGSGLGLAISKTIIEKHGGRIAFDSETGKGTTFYFELPRRV